jgi:hypothetical protein
MSGPDPRINGLFWGNAGIAGDFLPKGTRGAALHLTAGPEISYTKVLRL